MKKDGNDHYHIYTVQLTPGADGKFEIHQKTGGDAATTSTRSTSPGGRIVVRDERDVHGDGHARRRVRARARRARSSRPITVDGGDADRHLFSQNLSHTVAPFLRYDGKIGYSRWEHLGDVNDVKLLDGEPRRHADARGRGPARQAVELALQREGVSRRT